MTGVRLAASDGQVTLMLRQYETHQGDIGVYNYIIPGKIYAENQ